MIELMVVVVIMGVGFGVSAGRVHELMIQARVARAATAVQNDLEAAFAISARNRRPIRISWDATYMRLGVTDRAGTLTYRQTGLGPNAYGLTAGAVTFSRSPLEIYPNGMANDTLTITLHQTNYVKRVRMSRTGMVLVQ